MTVHEFMEESFKKKFDELDYFLEILGEDVDSVLQRLAGKKLISISEEMSDFEKATRLMEVIMKCDSTSKSFDEQVYEEVARIGFHTDEFHVSSNNDEVYDWGDSSVVDLYDDQVDFSADKNVANR